METQQEEKWHVDISPYPLEFGQLLRVQNYLATQKDDVFEKIVLTSGDSGENSAIVIKKQVPGLKNDWTLPDLEDLLDLYESPLYKETVDFFKYRTDFYQTPETTRKTLLYLLNLIEKERCERTNTAFQPVDMKTSLASLQQWINERQKSDPNFF